MATSFINDPEHWRKREEEARTLANQMNDETAQANDAQYRRRL
jgi:hypothetical protein